MIRNLLNVNKEIDDPGLSTDLELARVASGGDIVAFEEIYRRHHRRVYCICYRFLRNATETEDLVQEVFIQLYRKIGSYRGDAAFSTWLHRLTVNQVLMHLRKAIVKRERTTEGGENPIQIVSGTENPKKMPIVDKIALKRAITHLSTGYRNVFVLHDIEGYEHEEISKILGCATGTSKSQLHKARVKLRKLLGSGVRRCLQTDGNVHNRTNRKSSGNCFIGMTHNDT